MSREVHARFCERLGGKFPGATRLTFSTNQRVFPKNVAAQISDTHDWEIGIDLIKTIARAGFAVNPTKTRMQFRGSRQLVTGLTVNSKVNIRPEYYRAVRAMCHNLFHTGSYYRHDHDQDNLADADQQPELIESLHPLEGMLSHIHHVKNSVDARDKNEKTRDPTAARNLYSRFLKYRYFVRLEQPLIVCEGKTDYAYLKYAIRRLEKFHPKLGSWKDGVFSSAIKFFDYDSNASQVLNIRGGTGDLKYFFIKTRYQKDILSFHHRPLSYPVIVLLDNDDGAKDIFNIMSKDYSVEIAIKSSKLFYRVTQNLYLVKTQELGDSGVSYIEKFFPQYVLDMPLGGKKFNPLNNKPADDEYGKFHFADRVVRRNASTIDFSGFIPLLNRIVAVIDDYNQAKPSRR